MTTPTPSRKSRLFPVEHMTAAVLLADLADAERELDRMEALGDAAAVVRVRIVLGPRLRQLRRALATADRDRTQGVN